MGSVQRGQHELERPALHGQEILHHPAEDGAGRLPGLEQRRAGLRLQDQGQLLREVLRLLPRQLQHHDCSGEYKRRSVLCSDHVLESTKCLADDDVLAVWRSIDADEPEVHRLECAAGEGHVRRHRVPARRLRVRRGARGDPG